jgi:glycosyltransferase involved in cell wall biosynthesis
MKIAFVLGTSAGGTGRHVKMLAAGCAARGMQVEVFGPAQTDRAFGFTSAASPHTSTSLGTPAAPVAQVGFAAVDIADRPRVLADLRAIVRLRRLFEAGQPDLVHAHGLRAGALTAIALAFVRRRSGTRTPLVVTVHNASPEGALTGAIYRVLELIVARNTDSVLCVSPDLEQRMRAAGARRVARAVVPAPTVSLSAPPAGTPPTEIVPSRPGDVSAETRDASGLPASSRAGTAPSRPGDVSAETRDASTLPAGSPVGDVGSPPGDVSAETRHDAPAVPRGPVVLAVGRLAAQKGFGTLLAAASLWRDIRPEPVLVVIGDGPLEAELRGQAAALGLTVEFAGRRSDVPDLLARAAVFVLPSAWEGQPLVLQEAMRAGVPIVATRAGGTPALTGEDAAVLIPPGDPEQLATAVRAVLTEPALAARLRAAALARASLLPAEADAVAAALAEYDLVIRGG